MNIVKVEPTGPDFIFVQSLERNSALQRHVVGLAAMGTAVVSRRYLTLQASALMEFAKSTNNPELATVLVARAADDKAQVNETIRPIDPSLQAPDVEPSAKS